MLAEPGGLRVARGAFVARQTMSSLLRGVVDRGLAERAERAPEGRALPLRLTEKGQALLKRASGEVARIERQMTSGFDGDRLARLREDLSACVDALTEREDSLPAD